MRTFSNLKKTFVQKMRLWKKNFLQKKTGLDLRLSRVVLEMDGVLSGFF